MADVQEAFLHEQLLERRQRLEAALAISERNVNLQQLLNEVDSALERMEAGTFGLCATCHDTIEEDRLIADPLVRYCLDHLTASQRRALEQDLELASQLQRGLLPRQHSAFAGWEFCYHYQPLGLVSGDYCRESIPPRTRRWLAATRSFSIRMGFPRRGRPTRQITAQSGSRNCSPQALVYPHKPWSPLVSMTWTHSELEPRSWMT
jgi:RNA polymerase-binding transcription factor DksA